MSGTTLRLSRGRVVPAHPKPQLIAVPLHLLWQILRIVASSLLWTQLALVAIAVVSSLIFWHRPVMIVGGSMEPALHRGDMVTVSDVDPNTLKAPQIIMFDVGEGRVTHRIISLAADGSVVTKGDANAIVDTTTVPRDKILGRVTIVVPRVGLPMTWWQDGAWLHFWGWASLTAAAGIITLAPRRGPNKLKDATSRAARSTPSRPVMATATPVVDAMSGSTARRSTASSAALPPPLPNQRHHRFPTPQVQTKPRSRIRTRPRSLDTADERSVQQRSGRR